MHHLALRECECLFVSDKSWSAIAMIHFDTCYVVWENVAFKTNLLPASVADMSRSRMLIVMGSLAGDFKISVGPRANRVFPLGLMVVGFSSIKPGFIPQVTLAQLSNLLLIQYQLWYCGTLDILCHGLWLLVADNGNIQCVVFQTNILDWSNEPLISVQNVVSRLPKCT